jgi:tetratricopeptide (TPR) repeat protein
MLETPETVSQLNSPEEILAGYQSASDAGKNPDPRAYLERATELARAAAQAKTREERKRRRLTVVLAAAVVLIILGSSSAALWYLNDQARQEREDLLRQAEIARKLGTAEQDVRQNLKQAEEAHVKLLEELKKPGGVQGLLNQRSRWELQIKTARAAWQRAKGRADNAEGSLDSELANLLKKLDGELALDQRDYDLAWRLEKTRLDTATIVEGKINFGLAEREYPRVFAEAGLFAEPGRLKETAELIRQSVIREQLLAALEDWALTPDDLVRKRLLEALSLADPDPWANQVRKLAFSKNPAAIEKLADEIQRDQGLFGRLSQAMVIFLGVWLPEAKRESWLRIGQSRYPADFWCNFYLANLLTEKKQPMEAVGYYYAALAIRPNSSVVYNNLGIALGDQKNFPAAIDAYKKALAIGDNLAMAWNNLGLALYDQKNLAAAIDAYKKALAIDDNLAPVWHNLGLALYDQKNLPAAIDAHKKALAIDDKNAKAWTNLGIALYDQKNLPAAIDAYKKALAIDHKMSGTWSSLGVALREQKNLPAAIDAFKKALAIDDKNTMCRYQAACAAVLAAAGKGKDTDKLDAKQKSGLRREALKWLRADLAAYSMRLATGKQEDRTQVAQRLGDWMANGDLAGIRNDAALAKLPAEEQETWRKFWAEVEALRKKAGFPKGTP